jgi:hypothetical protein
MDRGVFRQPVGDEDSHLVAFDAFDGGARRLAVVTPQMRRHAGRNLAHYRFSDKVELLPVAVLTPRQRPAVEGHHRPVLRATGLILWNLHRGRCMGHGLRNTGRLRVRASQSGERRGRSLHKSAP